MDKECYLCRSNEKDEVRFGEFMTRGKISVHYFCLLLSSNLVQNGKDDQGFLGFLPKDIMTEAQRAKSLKCYFCKKPYANISCCAPKCHKSFHLTCGEKNSTEHNFVGTFQSFCHNHVKNKKVTQPQPDEKCCICYDNIRAPYEKFDTVKMIKAPCCKNGWFHKYCLAAFAKTAGYFFKCPLCNDSKIFRQRLAYKSIFIPDRDAAWELEPNAFAELLERPDKCSAANCCAEGGRQSETKRNEFVFCSTCGSVAIHRRCMTVQVKDFLCHECSSLTSAIKASPVVNVTPSKQIPHSDEDDVDEDEEEEIDIEEEFDVGTSDFYIQNASIDSDLEETIKPLGLQSQRPRLCDSESEFSEETASNISNEPEEEEFLPETNKTLNHEMSDSDIDKTSDKFELWGLQTQKRKQCDLNNITYTIGSSKVSHVDGFEEGKEDEIEEEKEEETPKIIDSYLCGNETDDEIVLNRKRRSNRILSDEFDDFQNTLPSSTCKRRTSSESESLFDSGAESGRSSSRGSKSKSKSPVCVSSHHTLFGQANNEFEPRDDHKNVPLNESNETKTKRKRPCSPIEDKEQLFTPHKKTKIDKDSKPVAQYQASCSNKIKFNSTPQTDSFASKDCSSQQGSPMRLRSRSAEFSMITPSRVSTRRSTYTLTSDTTGFRKSDRLKESLESPFVNHSHLDSITENSPCVTVGKCQNDNMEANYENENFYKEVHEPKTYRPRRRSPLMANIADVDAYITSPYVKKSNSHLPKGSIERTPNATKCKQKKPQNPFKISDRTKIESKTDTKYEEKSNQVVSTGVINGNSCNDYLPIASKSRIPGSNKKRIPSQKSPKGLTILPRNQTKIESFFKRI